MNSSFNNCFEIGADSWADECDVQPQQPKETQNESQQQKPKKEKKVQFVLEENQPKKESSNPFSIFDSDSDSDSEKNEEKLVTEEIISPSVVVFKEEDEKEGWETTKKKKKNGTSLNEGDKLLKCTLCRQKFIFTKDESEYFELKGWEPRKKCKECKQFQNQYGKMPRINRKRTVSLK